MGDDGAEKGCAASAPPLVAGRRSEDIFISRVSFLTFLVASCTVCVGSVLVMDEFSPLKAMIDFPSLDMATSRKAAEGSMEDADSGEDEAELSEIRGESKVEFVVVGDDSDDSENKDGRLSRWECGLLCC